RRHGVNDVPGPGQHRVVKGHRAIARVDDHASPHGLEYPTRLVAHALDPIAPKARPRNTRDRDGTPEPIPMHPWSLLSRTRDLNSNVIAQGFYDEPMLYDVLHGKGTAGEVRGLRHLADRLGLDPTGPWLEPACGSGRYVRAAVARGVRI